MSIAALLNDLEAKIGEYSDQRGIRWWVDYQQEERSTQLSTTDKHTVMIVPLAVQFASELEPLAAAPGGQTHYRVVLEFVAFTPKHATPLQGYDEIFELFRFLLSHGMRRGGDVYLTVEEVSALEYTQEAGQVIGRWQQRYHLRFAR